MAEINLVKILKRSEKLNLYYKETNSTKQIQHILTMAQRVTYRRRNPYNTRSNKIKVVKTPGGVLRAQHVKKSGTRPKCGDCGIALAGISALRPREYAQVSKTHKTVSRAYGGSRCANCVKERVVRAFLIEEQKIVKRVLKEQAEKEQKAEKKASKSKK